MKIQLIDYDERMCDAWNFVFKSIENITITNGDYFSNKADIIVSPANSFGYMDGGLDGRISKYFNLEGINIQELTQAIIKRDFDGELLVGQYALIPTGSKTIPFMLCIPTMRIPSIIMDAVDVYLAAKAIFQFIKKNKQKYLTITVCGLGTGVGGVKSQMCANSMFKAYQNYYLKDNYFPTTLYMAADPHQILHNPIT